MAVDIDVEQLDEVELRMLLDEAIVDALELADGLASLVSRGDGLKPEAGRFASNYLTSRETARQLRRALVVAVAG